MADISDILNIARQYTFAEKQANRRYDLWINGGKYLLVKDTLSQIVSEICEQNEWFRDNLFVDDSNFPKVIAIKSNGIILLSGTESGLGIVFYQMDNGKIAIEAIEHSKGLDANVTLVEVFDTLEDMDEKRIYDAVFKAFEIIQKSSYLFQ